MAKKKTKKPLDSSACGVLARGKKAWKDFEVIKVKLNPEQAVLSCCSVLNGRIENAYNPPVCEQGFSKYLIA